MMKIFLYAFFLFLPFNAISGINPAIDIRHYRFELILNDSTDVIVGKSTLTLTLTREANELTIDLTQRLADGKGMIVKSVFVGDSKTDFKQADNKLTIIIPKGKAGEEKMIVISYSGIPQDGLIISKNKFGDRTFFGDNWPDRAHHWLPVVDHPSDKATVEFIVTAPLHYEVIANGVKLEESILDNVNKLTHWRQDEPISTKVMVIAAARFAIQCAGEAANVPVENWVFPQNRLDGFHDFRSTNQILDFFHNNIGAYPFKKLANVQSKTRYGGMENASNIFYFENFVNGKADHDDLIAHEIAHQWFGNSATESDWHHVWLSEGFATYFTQLYNEHTYGKEKRAADMASQRQKVIEFSKKNQNPVVLTTLPGKLIGILNAHSYQKGGWILHMLRVKLGDDIFWKGIRQYYKRYKYANAATADFQNVMEEASGQDLDGFFKQWLFTPGHPVLEVSWKPLGSSGSIEVSVTQTQPGPIFSFPLQIGITAGEKTVQTLQISAKTQKFNLKVGQKPEKIDLDPNVNLLFEGKLQN